MSISVNEKAKRLRNSPEYREWRNACLKRDEYKCTVCGGVEHLEVDHIKPFALYPHLILDISNGRTICKPCHKKTNTYGSLSKWKGNENIHPILSGDLLHKINSLPRYIEVGGHEVGLKMIFSTHLKKWKVGYKIHYKIDNQQMLFKITSKDESLDDAIDRLFDKLRSTAGQLFG